jgi:hypothetical protein
MNAERRQNPRAKLREIVYLQMEAENGGLVLNVSETGLAFQAATPVHRGETVRFSFSLPGGKDIRAVSEVAWMDDTHKTGGMRFTFLPEGARQQIRRFVGVPPAVMAATAATADVAIPEVVAPSVIGAEAPFTASEPAIEPHGASLIGSRAFYSPERAIQPGADYSQPENRDPSVWAVALGGFIGLVIAVLAGGILYFHFAGPRSLAPASKTETSAVQSQAPPPSSNANAGTSASGEGDTAASPPADQRIPQASVGSQNHEARRPEIAPPRAASRPQGVQSAARASAPETTPSARPGAAARSDGEVRGLRSEGDDGEAELAAAERYLDAPNGTRDGVAAALLWEAVSKGNSSAEVMLADLYLRGVGVARSCEQARVLVTAAAQRGNELAAQKLRSLAAAGCR